MDIILEQQYETGDKAFYASHSGGKTIFLLVKVDDVLRVEKLTDDSYKIFYNVFIYDSTIVNEAVAAGTTPVLKTMTIEESQLITYEAVGSIQDLF